MTVQKRWWILGAMGTATAALVVSGTVWWHSTADLDEVAARARAMGILVRHDDIQASEMRDPDDIAALLAIQALAEEASILEVFAFDDLSGDVRARILNPGAVPDPLVGMAIAHGDAAVARLRSALDALPDRTLRMGILPSTEPPRVSILVVRGVVDALIPWVRGGAAPLDDLTRMTRFVDAVHQDWWLDAFSELIRARQRVMQVASGRWADWPASCPLVDVWVRWRDEPILSAAAMRREVQVWWGIHHDYRPNDIAAILGDHTHVPWFTTMAVRRGRAEGLHACLDLIAVLAATTADNPRHDAARQLITRSHQVSLGWRRDLLNPAGICLSQTGYLVEQILGSHARQRIQAALLVALIRGEPIPVDPTDAAGKPLRRYERNGELIGYYACGDDGVDNGGSREDWRFPFDREWDPPPTP